MERETQQFSVTALATLVEAARRLRERHLAAREQAQVAS